jgi:predicted DNA-binding protein with PD1-like motif
MAGATVGAASDVEPAAVPASPMTVRALRLGPGADLKRDLSRFARANGMRAGIVLTCVGSLTRAVVRLADQPEATTFEGKHEIVSLVGTLSPDGDHLHVAISDGQGRTVGGHLMEGSIVYTTAEIAVGELEALAFARELDPRTTFRELVVGPRR